MQEEKIKMALKHGKELSINWIKWIHVIYYSQLSKWLCANSYKNKNKTKNKKQKTKKKNTQKKLFLHKIMNQSEAWYKMTFGQLADC